MPDSPLTRYAGSLPTNPLTPPLAGIGWWDQRLSQHAADRAEQRRRLTALAGRAAAQGDVLEQVRREHPEWDTDDWDRFYQANPDAFTF